MNEAGARQRRRGRPRKTAQGDTRSQISDAAAAEFAEKGYDAASIRGIARRAGVDSALVHHYFDTKAALFAAVVNVPVRPDRVVAAALDVPVDQLGASIVRAVLTAWERPGVRPIAVTVLRTAVSGSRGAPLIREFLLRELVSAIVARLQEEHDLGVEESRLRAELAMSQIAGVLIMRFVLGAEPLASTPIDDLVALLGPAVQGHLDGRDG